MSFVSGAAVESFTSAEQALRDRIAGRLIDLLLREILELGVV
jgi:hypothetical protein